MYIRRCHLHNSYNKIYDHICVSLDINTLKNKAAKIIWELAIGCDMKIIRLMVNFLESAGGNNW